MSDAVALAERYLELNRPDEAAVRIAAHLARHPDDVEALCLSALIALHRDDEDGAEQAARRAAGIEPDSDLAARLLSIALGAQGRPADALRAADRARTLNPQAWQNHANRAELAARVQRADRDAVLAAEQAVRLAPDVPETHDALGAVLLQRGRLSAARTSFERSLRIDPADVVARRGLAVISARRLRPWRAWRTSAAELARNPEARGAAAVLRFAAHRTVWVVAIVLGACARIGDMALAHRADDGGPPGHEVPVALLAVVVLLVGGWLGLGFARSGGGWRAVRGALRVHPALRWWAALSAVALVLFAVAAIVPPEGARMAYTCAFFLAVFGIWRSEAGLRSKRRRGPARSFGRRA